MQLHNTSDALIWLAYLLIPVILVSFARKRPDLPYSWVFLLFGAFIIGCGLTHLIEVVTFYTPMYRFAALVKLLTAIVSLGTAAALIPIMPQALALRSPQALQREIDERLRVEEQLRALAQELQRSNQELQEFAAVASHDLQEPLRKIQAFGDRIANRFDPVLDAEGKDYLGRMMNAAGRMRQLIDDLLSFSRVSTMGQPFRETSLARVVGEVLGDLEARIAETGGQVEVGSLPTIQADPTQMRQLLQNLIGNGLKFHRPGSPPRIFVRGEIRRDEGGEAICELIVADEGIGFEPRYAERILNLFQRLHGRNEYEGTGMGLAICRKIVERHGGTIVPLGEPGRGATFVVSLPVTRDVGGTP